MSCLGIGFPAARTELLVDELTGRSFIEVDFLGGGFALGDNLLDIDRCCLGPPAAACQDAHAAPGFAARPPVRVCSHVARSSASRRARSSAVWRARAASSASTLPSRQPTGSQAGLAAVALIRPDGCGSIGGRGRGMEGTGDEGRIVAKCTMKPDCGLAGIFERAQRFAQSALAFTAPPCCRGCVGCETGRRPSAGRSDRSAIGAANPTADSSCAIYRPALAAMICASNSPNWRSLIRQVFGSS